MFAWRNKKNDYFLADKKCLILLQYSKNSGPSCSKLTTSLVYDSLKSTSSDTQIY